MNFQDIETFLQENRTVVFSLLIPVLSAAIAAFASWYSTKRALRTQKTERDLQRVLKLCDFRQAWINELRLEFAQFCGFLNGVHPLSEDRLNEMALCYNKIVLRVNHEDADFEELICRMTDAMLNQKTPGSIDELSSNRTDLAIVMSRILKKEWDRLKHDLRESEVGGGLL
ncbi:MAG: hypothetical protein RLO10_15875 [Roseovarius indicus]